MIHLQAVLALDGTLVSVVSKAGATLALPYGSTTPVRLQVKYEDGRAVDMRSSSCTLSVREASRMGMRQVTLVLTEGRDAADGVLTGDLVLPTSLYPGEYRYELTAAVNGYTVYLIGLSAFFVTRTGSSP
jgi:hypothetical protein